MFYPDNRLENIELLWMQMDFEPPIRRLIQQSTQENDAKARFFQWLKDDCLYAQHDNQDELEDNSVADYFLLGYRRKSVCATDDLIEDLWTRLTRTPVKRQCGGQNLMILN